MSKLVSLIDRRILPLVSLLYLLAFLCRVNIANVHTEINKTFDMTEEMYASLIIAFYITYTLLEVPSNLCLKRFGAPLWLSLLSFAWGLFCLLSAFSPNYLTLFVYRLLTGSVEAGIFPGILYYLSFWYVKSERGLRFSIFFLAAIVASSISGLLAFALLQLDGSWGLAGWQWVLMLESIPSILLSPVIFFYLPQSPGDAKWLSDDLKAEARQRFEVQSAGPHEEREDDFVVPVPAPPARSIRRSRGRFSTLRYLMNPMIWLFALMYFFVCLPLASVSFFLPKMIQLQLRLNSIMSNLVTVPIYIVTAVFVLWFSRNSDRNGERALHTVAACIIGTIGFGGLFIIDYFTSNIWISLAFTQLAVIGSNATIPIACVWLAGIVPQTNRSLLAISTGTMIALGQLSGIVSPTLYAYLGSLAHSSVDDEDVANYKYAHLTMALSMIIASFICFIIKWALARKNYFAEDSIADDEEEEALLAYDNS